MADPVVTYPFPSKVHVLSCVTLKLNDSNYLLWKTQFESLLSSQKFWGFVNGLVVTPPATRVVLRGTDNVEEANPQFEAWFCTDQLVRSWLFGTLSEEVQGSVHTLSTSREVWLSLADNFNKSPVSREFSLRRSLQLLTKKDKTLAVYGREFKSICDALSAIGKPIDDSMKIFGFLNGLGREFDPITTVIQSSLTKFPSPTFNDVISEVQGFDLKLKFYEETPAVNPHMAFASQNTAPGYNPNYRGRGRSSQYRGRGGYSSRGRGFPQHQSSTPSQQGTRPTCQICGRVGHTALKCYNMFDNNFQPPTAAFNSLRVAEDKDWIPDSGATAHITSSSASLQGVHPYEGTDAVMIGDGAYLPITHVGSATIPSASGNISLNDVLVCPDIQKSLLSVSRLCEDHPYGVFFDAKNVYQIDLHKEKVVAKGPRDKGLYKLKSDEVAVFFSDRQIAASEDIWHLRLGHANFNILQQLKLTKEISVNKNRTNLVCQSCQMGKSSKLQFFHSQSHVSVPLEKIHCDLWGPSPIVSSQEFQCYEVLVDDCTRFSWLYPLANKSDFFQIFVAFKKLVALQEILVLVAP